MIELLIAFFLLALITSFLCSLWESVLLSITPAYAEVKLQEGGPVGKRLQDFKLNIDKPLSAILSLNTFANTAGALGVGYQATAIWGDADPSITLFIVPAILTISILVFSELIPKTIGANHWKSLTDFTINSLGVLVILLAPLVWFSKLVTYSLNKNKDQSVFTRLDFLAMAKLGEKEGVIEKDESQFIDSLLNFKGVQASDIMTPRTVIKASPDDVTIKEFYENNRGLRFSRIPVFQQKDLQESVTGYILKDEMLDKLVHGDGEEPLSAISREIMVVDEDFPIPELFQLFLTKREHIALIVDEFGGIAGIVTMEDVIETLLGQEILDEMDSTDDMRELARLNWERRAKSLGLIQEASKSGGKGGKEEKVM